MFVLRMSYTVHVRMNSPTPPPGRRDYQSRIEERHSQSFPRFQAVGKAPKSALEKALSFFADVRAGEGATVALLTVNVFLLLFAYYLLKTVRESLILAESGAYVKAYSSAGQAALLMLIIPVYGYVGTKVVRIRLIVGLLLFFAANLVMFYAAGVAGVREGVVFYIWVGIFNVFSISQVWAFANDIYTEGQGKRLFPVIGVGSSLGAWLGAEGAKQFIKRFHASPYELQLVAGALLLVCCAIVAVVNKLAARRSIPEMARHAEEKLAPGDGFALIFRDRYLAWVAVLMVLLNLVNSTGEFLLGDLVTANAESVHPGNEEAQKEFLGAFYGSFFANVNLLGFILQAFVVARILPVIGVRRALFVLPAISLLTYSTIGLVPLLGLVRWGKIFENATDYSLQNTVKQALFLPTSREAKYKAKAAVDTFFMRFGDVLHAAVVAVGAVFHLAFTGFAWINVCLVLVWIYAVTRLSREHRRMQF
jgi:AAA family ATP:ADP antiporter